MYDLTILEIVNLLTVGISSFNTKYQVTNYVGDHNQYISPDNLKSQEYINKINARTLKQKMKINDTKTKCMVFNFTTMYQFNTRLKLKDKILDTVNEIKLSGTIITNDIKWDRNKENIVKKPYTRMAILRKLSNF